MDFWELFKFLETFGVKKPVYSVTFVYLLNKVPRYVANYFFLNTMGLILVINNLSCILNINLCHFLQKICQISSRSIHLYTPWRFYHIHINKINDNYMIDNYKYVASRGGLSIRPCTARPRTPISQIWPQNWQKLHRVPKWQNVNPCSFHPMYKGQIISNQVHKICTNVHEIKMFVFYGLLGQIPWHT